MAKRVVLVGLLLAGLAAAWLTGVFERLDVESLRGLVEAAGIWGPLLFVLLFGLEGLAFPGTLFMLAAIALWPPGMAFLLNWLGALVASLVGFFYARTVGREFIAERLPERFRGLERRVVERGFETVIVVRLLFFMAPWAHWAFGLSPIGWRPYLIGSALAYLPWVALITFFGSALLAWLTAQAGNAWLQAALAALALLAVLVLWRRLRRSSAAPSD